MSAYVTRVYPLVAALLSPEPRPEPHVIDMFQTQKPLMTRAYPKWTYCKITACPSFRPYARFRCRDASSAVTCAFACSSRTSRCFGVDAVTGSKSPPDRMSA